MVGNIKRTFTATLTWIVAAFVSLTNVAETKEQVPGDVFVGIGAEIYYLTTYSMRRPDFKAIAIGPAGVWYPTFATVPESAASQNALIGCQNLLEKSRYKSIRKRKCHLYAVGDKIVFAGELPKLPLGKALTGEDIPLKRAIYDRSPKGKLRGILLRLHGCNRPKRVSKWERRWFAYFQRAGFRVIMPNSFAERRPPQTCIQIKRGWAIPLPLHVRPLVPKILRTRTAQTIRTLQTLKMQFPNLPILIWGHSEGGAVAQLIADNVAGILTTGIDCRGHLVKSNVPLLSLIGGSDRAITRPQKLTRDNVTRLCQRIFHWETWNFVYLKGVGHFPSIRNNKVKKAVDEFIERSMELYSRSAT